MKITSTKKLIIILLTLICALAVGLGVMWSAAETPSALSATAVSVEDGAEPDEAELPEEESEEKEYEEYDPAFDEARLRALAEELQIDFAVVNFYAHANNISVEELEAQLNDEKLVVPWDEQFYDASTNSIHYTDEDMKAVGVADEAHEHNEDGECVLGDDTLADRINGFRMSYAKGETVLEGLDENADWFISPDEVSEYLSWNTWVYCGPTSHGVQFWTNKQGYINLSWSYNFPTVAGYGAYNGIYNNLGYNDPTKLAEFNLLPSKGGWGQYATITLEPGEIFAVGAARYNDHHDWVRSWATTAGLISRYSGDSVSDRAYYWGYFDGDAPTGTVLQFYKSTVTNYAMGESYDYGLYRRSSTGCTTSNPGHYSRIYRYEIQVIRNAPERPVIVSDDDGATISGNTKTMEFTGEPAHISFYPDWGSCLLKWTASSDNVGIYDRALHGEAVKNLTLEVNVAGTYYITLSTPANKWADGSVGSVTFTFILKIAETAKPTMKMEEGVGSNRKDKYVNDTGQVQTVTFENCDPAYLQCESNGLLVSEWDPVEKRLVLYQDKQNAYSISISIKNPAACNWKGGGTASQGFTFTIGPRLINKMSIEKLPGDDGTVSGNTKIVQYDTEDQTLVLTPARRGSLNIITSMKYDYVYEDPEDEYGKLVFTTVDANRFDIIVYPASGHVWDDQSKTEYTFTFIIETIKIRAPYLDEKNVEVINGIKTKTVTYDQTMRVQFYSEAEAEGVNIITAMTRNEDESTGGTVVLTATNATEYPINFTPKVNYEWAEGVAAPGFSLIIKRYQLGTPYVIHDDREDAEGFIENNTKTVGYQPNGMTLEGLHVEARAHRKLSVEGRHVRT